MAYWAIVDNNNFVTTVIVADNETTAKALAKNHSVVLTTKIDGAFAGAQYIDGKFLNPFPLEINPNLLGETNA